MLRQRRSLAPGRARFAVGCLEGRGGDGLRWCFFSVDSGDAYSFRTRTIIENAHTTGVNVARYISDNHIVTGKALAFPVALARL